MSTDPAALVPYLDVFPEWLRTLGADAAALGRTTAETQNDDVRRYCIAGLNYVFKSLDLIPDGIEDLGYCDDAFVIRVAASLTGETEGILGRLSEEAKQVEGFLGEDYPRLVAYVEGLRKGAARGRTVDDIMSETAIRETFLREVEAWASEYAAASFTRDVKTLIKLKAFLAAKLA
jgi:uncharacterized membrane protein YkvA (DUF1232 family)